MNDKILICLITSLLLLSGCDRQEPSASSKERSASTKEQSTTPLISRAPGYLDRERLLNSQQEPGQWLTGGRDYQQSYYSPLTSINKTNVQTLGFAWDYPIDTTRGLQATPIVIDGLMFTSGPGGAVYSLDAKTGRERWHFTPPNADTEAFRRDGSGSQANRGVAVWQGSVYVSSLDGHLYSLSADTGDVQWQVDTLEDKTRAYTITGAVYVAKDVVVVGNSGAEFDARGYVTGYDLKTGEKRWRFYIVPRDPKEGQEHPELEMAAKTWSEDTVWEAGLGGTAWDGMAYDPELNLLYVGTGNGAPWPQTFRSPGGGDNLFLSSILAINPDTGRLAWYYQTTPGDSWDYNAAQKMILADLQINGQTRQVIMQAPKNGFFYVLDRKTGELLSAKPYVTVNWASHVDMNTGKPVKTGLADYSKQNRMIFPAPTGGHGWQPMAFNPKTQLVYIPTIEHAAVFESLEGRTFTYQRGGVNASANYYYTVPGPWGLERELAQKIPLEEIANGHPDHTVRGFLRAWNPVTQEKVWEVETSGDWAGQIFATYNGGGVMTTASNLVFQGRGSGELYILDAETGDELHRIDVGTSLMAAPMSYSVDGEQYVAIMAGVGGVKGSNPPPGTAAYRYGNQGRIIAFKLGGSPVPHPPEKQHHLFPKPPLERYGSQDQLQLGQALFNTNCIFCHGNANSSVIPDLRRMKMSTHKEFNAIVLDGIRAQKGMSGFKDVLSIDQAEAIHAYLVELAWWAYEDSQKLNGNKPETMH